MNKLQIFNNPEFGEVRTVEIESKVYFAGSDVARALGYDQPHKAVERHCRYGMKHTVPHPQSADKTIEMNFIPEGDVYRLATHSKLPGAERFESWVFDEVVPSVAKHGAYMTPETLAAVLQDPDTIIQLATNLKAEQEKNRQLSAAIEEQVPKVLFADAVSVSKSSILIGELAKILKQNGIEIGQNRLFEWLRQKGYLISRKGADYNRPTQRSMDLGLFSIKETVITHADGHTSINITTKVTGKGQIYFVNKFLELPEAV